MALESVTKPIIGKLEKFGISAGYTLLVIGAAILLTTVNVTNPQLDRAISLLITLSPIWLPLVLFFVFFEKWMAYVQYKFRLDQGGRVTIEIMIPEEIYKSPEAMEVILTQLWQVSSPDNLFQTYLDGKHPPTYGLEIVSTGGRVHFYVNAWRKKLKNIIEAQFYAQYPGIEMRELPIDYAAEIPKGDAGWQTFTLHFGLKKDDVLPIKTYVDYGLLDLPKEEEKVDPITTMIDTLANIGPNERIWYQILIRAHREENFEVGSLHKKSDWKDAIDKAIEDVYSGAKKRGKSEDDEGGGFTPLTDGEKQKIKALERSRSKYAFNTKIRIIYAAKKEDFLPGERIGALITSFFPYNDANMNQIGLKWRTDIGYKMWADPKEKKITAWKWQTLDHYKRRYFDPMDSADRESIMSVEEIASLFHLPGRVELNPNLERIPSTRGEAPPNLPIG